MSRFHNYALKSPPAFVVLAAVVAALFAGVAAGAESGPQANQPAGPKAAASAMATQGTTTNTATANKETVAPPAKTNQMPVPPTPVPPVVEEDNRDLEPIDEDSGSGDSPFSKGKTREAKAKAGVLDREGRRLIERTGHLERTGGQTRFIFDSDEKPLVVLPGHSLEMMEEVSDFGKRPITFTISGVICEYRNRNFLQLIGKPQLGSGPPSGDEDKEPANPSSATSATATPAAEPRNRTLPPEPTRLDIPKLEPVTPPATKGANVPREVAGGSFAGEGQHVVDQEGRIDRSGDQTRFIFDSGDPPILLQSNKKLEAMENVGDYGRRPLRFRISGIATEYRGRKYLSMTKMVVIPKFTENL